MISFCNAHNLCQNVINRKVDISQNLKETFSFYAFTIFLSQKRHIFFERSLVIFFLQKKSVNLIYRICELYLIPIHTLMESCGIWLYISKRTEEKNVLGTY